MGTDLEEMSPAVNGLSLSEWHARFEQQAGWTAEVRRHLFTQAGLNPGARVLEVGCGTGAVMQALNNEFDYHLTGVDIDPTSLVFNHAKHPTFPLAQGDGHHLPFANDTFDAAFCHYLLLWVADPAQVLAEMRRVTRRGGVVIALAEPDYASRIDAPPPLDELGRLQTQALARQGIDPEMGAKLAELFRQTGLVNTYSAILNANSNLDPHVIDLMEWTVLRADLAGLVTEQELAQFATLDREARALGERVLYIPTAYAMGWVN
jgi:ubiquinone/menaquinone biosynthesis C-methylase UbiE